ncbi:hypothetical protein cypCar_00026653 [Cyprinus carpio]|nr:hypothetical protein cypCar_00026653 [Cyprinus carpio]
MAASETCSSVPESPEPESCDGPQLDQNQTLQNQNQKKEEEDEDEEDEGSELQEPSDPECVEERFRIDRKKLELMLYGQCLIDDAPAEGSGLSGEEFFQKIQICVLRVCARESDLQDLQPLVLTFDLPVTLVGGVVCDTGSPVIQHVAQAFGVSVSFRTQPKLYCSTCSVRGTQGNAAAVKKATCVLMELLLGTEALAGVTGVMVSTQLDVTSQQHLFLLGQNGANFLTVMHQTHTQIILPDLSAPQHTPSLLIQGTADGVCVARQQLMDCLPVCLMFDLKDEGESDPRKLAQMMHNLGVFISVKPKVKQTAKSVVVKGLERNIGSLYEARRLLLGLDSTEVSMTTKNVFEVTKTPVDPLVANNGITSYWINVLMQQLRLNETGAVPSPEAMIGSLSGKPRPLPPPGLTVSSEDGRIGIKGVESKLEKIPETEDQPTQAETESSITPHAEVTEVREVVVKPTVSSRRGSQSEALREPNPLLMPERSVRVEVDGFYLNRDRRCSLRIFPSVDTNNEDHEYERKKLLATQGLYVFFIVGLKTV